MFRRATRRIRARISERGQGFAEYGTLIAVVCIVGAVVLLIKDPVMGMFEQSLEKVEAVTTGGGYYGPSGTHASRAVPSMTPKEKQGFLPASSGASPSWVNSSYGFIEDGAYYRSTNQGVSNSVSITTFEFEIPEGYSGAGYTLECDWASSGEMNFDYTFLTLYRDNVKVSGTLAYCSASGSCPGASASNWCGYGSNQSATMSVASLVWKTASVDVATPGTYRLTIGFRKDGSQNSNLDTGYFKTPVLTPKT